MFVSLEGYTVYVAVSHAYLVDGRQLGAYRARVKARALPVSLAAAALEAPGRPLPAAV